MPHAVELPDDAKRETMILSAWYRARHSRGYRRKDERILGASVDPDTGIERSEADLLSPGEALRGPEFVVAAAFQPEEFAAAVLMREEPNGNVDLTQVRGYVVEIEEPDVNHPGATQTRVVMTATLAELGRVEEEVAHRCRVAPEQKARYRKVQGKQCWTEEEAAAVADLKYLFQRTMLDFARKGWMSLESPVAYDSPGPVGLPGMHAQSGLDDRGMPFVGHATMEGVEEAERRIAADPYWSQGAFSMLATASSDVKNRAMVTSPWATQKLYEEQ